MTTLLKLFKIWDLLRLRIKTVRSCIIASFELLILKKGFLLDNWISAESILVRDSEYDGGECQVYHDGVGNVWGAQL